MGGQRKALIIANDAYSHKALLDLHGPGADAEALSSVLADPQIGDFEVQVVRNESAHVVAGEIEDVFSESRPDDLLLVHYSGHGLKSESGDLFFAASNTRPDRLGSTAVAADFLQRCMRHSRSRSVVLLLDCCYSGAFANGVRVRAAGDVNLLDSFPRGQASGGRGRAVITASSALEFAFEETSQDDGAIPMPSLFTGALIEGLTTGDADRDEDGWVSLNELYDYVFDKVRERNPHQTPSRWVDLEGELYLARSRRRRIRPAPIPGDLTAALADTNMYTRLGAVTELRSRLIGDNLPTAVAAYEILADLASTASRYLAEPAAEAIRQAAPRPARTELHFGPVQQAADPPHQVVDLLGPPIARACVPRPSHAWIRVDQTDGGLDISIDTASSGRLQGSLGLRGPAGDAAITIDVELLERPSSAPAPAQPEISARNHLEWNLGQVAGVTDRGTRHYRNEDAMDFAVADTEAGPVAVAIVVDGISSAPRSDESSRVAVDVGTGLLAEQVDVGVAAEEASLAAFKAAASAVAALADPDGAPAATYVSAVVSQERITVCWLGDCRAYWLAARPLKVEGPNETIEITGGSRRVTRDDTLVEEIVAAGLATTEEAQASPQAHTITGWIGAGLPDALPHIEQFTPNDRGALLLCTDGLWHYCPEAADLAAMALPGALENPLRAAADLVKYALDAGGLDNVTAVLIPFPPRA